MRDTNRYVILYLAIILLISTTAIADEYLWDQTNDFFEPTGAQGIYAFSPIGQEFIPDFNSLEVVQLYIVNIEGTAEFFVEIYSGNIAGPLIGSSNLISISGFYIGPVTFTFDTVLLIPGIQHVMIINETYGDAGVGSIGSTYPSGCQILSGIPQANNDLWFREGVFEGSALNRLSWGSIKNLCW